MPKIQDIIHDFQVSRDDIAAAYKKATGKALTARAVNIKDEEWSLIEKELGGKKGKSAPASAAKDDSKVLKSDELFGGDDFLSGLGF